MGKTVKSTFNKDAQGWTMNDGSPAAWVDGGGNPGGYFGWSDSNDGDSYYAAPDAFIGAKKAFYGGALSYDIFDSANDYSGVPDVELVGANGLTLVATLGQPGTSWTHFSIALDQTGGWHTGSLGGALATRIDIKSVLADLSQVLIRAEYHSGQDETAGLDNVFLTKPAPPAAPIVHDASLLAGAHVPIHDHAHLAIA